MATIGSWRAIQLLDLVDEFGYSKSYNGLTSGISGMTGGSNDLVFINSLSQSNSYQLAQTTNGLVNYNYYQLGLTYSF